MLHPANSTYSGDELLGKVNQYLGYIGGGDLSNKATFDLRVGMLFNPLVARIQFDGDMPLPSTVEQTQSTVVFASLYRWIYGHVSGKKKYDHPYDWGNGHIYYMLHRMEQA